MNSYINNCGCDIQSTQSVLDQAYGNIRRLQSILNELTSVALKAREKSDHITHTQGC